MATNGPDLLFLLRNNFYLGAYQAAINESHVEGLAETESIERDCLVYRSYIALGTCQVVIDEINVNSPTALQAVKLLALYTQGGVEKEKARETVQELVNDSATSHNTTVLLVAATIFAHEKNFADALKCTHGTSNLELLALSVQIYLKMDRQDYAEKQLKAMQQLDEDHTLTQLANAWLNVALGGSKVQEAFYIFQELCEKYTWTVPLMNGSAVCNMSMARFEDAETTLLEALSKDAKNADVLANLIVCDLHLGKPISRYLNQLRSTAPSHVLVQRMTSAGENFERAVASYA